MSINAPDWFRPQYESRAMHIYQNKGNRLRPTVSPATSFSGSDKAIFYLAGLTTARKIDGNTTPSPGGGDRKKFEVSLATFQAFDELKQYDLDRLTIPEREIIYQAGAMALGRATDKEIYDTMKTALPSVTSGCDFHAAAFSAANAMLLCEALQGDHVDWDGEVYCGLPQRAWNNFLANKVVNSSDYVGPNDLPFVKATQTRYWNGVNWFLQVEQSTDDLYLTHDTDQIDAFIWHKSAIGWGTHTDLIMIPQWDNRGEGGGCWTFNMQAKGAATTLQEGNGIKRFTVSKTATTVVV